MRPISFALAFAAFLGLPLHANASDKLAVLELYTSQGCSSCPPADKYLQELSERKNLITFACHVDYWNALGWTDPYSLRVCSDRQRIFARTSGDKRVYTPAMQINGERSIVGHDRPDIEIAISKGRDLIGVPIAYMKSTNTLSYRLPPVNKGDRVYLFTIGESTTVPIGKGENSGRTLSVTRPVIAANTLETRIGLTHLKLTPSPQTAGYVIVVHEGQDGKIKAAGKIDL